MNAGINLGGKTLADRLALFCSTSSILLLSVDSWKYLVYKP